MRRRAAIALVVGAAAAWPLGADADQAARIAVLGPPGQPRSSALVARLRQGLLAQGYAAQRIDIIEVQVARGDRDGLAAAAREARRQGTAVIFAVGSEVARPVRDAAPDVPIVFITPGDPVASGLIASFARPGGNMTGITFEFPELSGKRLELIRDVVGGGRRVLVVVDPRDASSRQGMAAVRDAARALGMALAELEFAADDDRERVAQALAGVAALLVIPGGAPTAYHAALIHAAHEARVATLLPARTESTREALITYGARDGDVARDAARLIDRILDGANAGEIPVERPTRISLVVNLRTARALGLAVPPTLLARADEVIE